MSLPATFHRVFLKQAAPLVFLLAGAMLPIGIAHGQDFEAFQKRLHKAVKKQEITLEQAAFLMEALKDAAAEKHRGELEHRPSDAVPESHEDIPAMFHKAGVSQQILEPVVHHLMKEGIVDDQLHKTLRGMLWIVHRLTTGDHQPELSPEQIHQYFRQEAELNEDQAKMVVTLAHRMAQGKPEGEGHSHDPRVEKFQALQQQVRQAVEAGKLTEKEAEQKLLAIRKALFENQQPNELAQREEIARKIKEAVKAGKLSEAEAREKWETLEREWGSNKEAHREEQLKQRLTEARKYLEAAVAAGKIGEDDAKAKWAEVEKRIRSEN